MATSSASLEGVGIEIALRRTHSLNSIIANSHLPGGRLSTPVNYRLAEVRQTVPNAVLEALCLSPVRRKSQVRSRRNDDGFEKRISNMIRSTALPGSENMHSKLTCAPPVLVLVPMYHCAPRLLLLSDHSLRAISLYSYL